MQKIWTPLNIAKCVALKKLVLPTLIPYDDFPSEIHPSSWTHQIHIISMVQSDQLTSICLPLNIKDPAYFLTYISRWTWNVAEAVLLSIGGVEEVKLLSENPRGEERKQDVPYGRSSLPVEIQHAFTTVFPRLWSEGLLRFR